jgi:DNA-binding transcriptional MerR regulator
VNEPSASIFFTDGKAPDAMRTIGEVANGFGIKQHILRYWEQQFPMLRPLKRSGGRRLYRPEDVALVAEIDRLINLEGYTLKGARQVIESGDQAADETIVREAKPHAVDVLDRLKAVRGRLSDALAAA